MNVLFNYFNVVVLGDMTPGAHHPEWYRSLDAIDADEAKKAVNSELVITVAASQFVCGTLRVRCKARRYEVSTEDMSQFFSVQRAAHLAMDALPNQVDAVGFNFNAKYETHADNVVEALRSRVTSFGEDGFKPINIQVAREHHGGLLTLTVQPGDTGPKSLFVGVNTHYPLANTGLAGKFSMKDFIKERVWRDKDVAEKLMSQVLDSVNGG